METFSIRGGRPRDKDALMAFYTTDERDTLPSPSYPDLIDALAKQSLLIVRREAPHDIDAERRLLGAILVNNDALYRVSDFLESKHYFEPLHQMIFETASSLILTGKVVSPVTLRPFLPTDTDIGVTMAQYLARLATEATVIDAQNHGRTIHELSSQRELIRIGEDMIDFAYNEPVGECVATAGYFEYAKSNAAHVIYELAGTRVKNSIGRLKPVSLQRIMIALRVIQVAATEAGPVTLISSARSAQSIKNLEAMGFEPIDPKPGWFEFDLYSWTRPTERSEWRHLIATQHTVDAAMKVLETIDFSKGAFDCLASQRQLDGSNTERAIRLEFAMTWAGLFSNVIDGHRDGGLNGLFVPLPATF